MIPFNQSSSSQPITSSHPPHVAPENTISQPPPPHPPPIPPPTLSQPPPAPAPAPAPAQPQPQHPSAISSHPSCIHHQQHSVPLHMTVNLPPHPEHHWAPDTNPSVPAPESLPHPTPTSSSHLECHSHPNLTNTHLPPPHPSSQQLQPHHHPSSYDASPYAIGGVRTDKPHLYHHSLAVIPPHHLQPPQVSPSTHPSYIYPVHNHLVAPVAHVPIGAAHYAHLPSSIWTSPHGQYHPAPAPLPSTPRPSTNLSQLHPSQIHPQPQHHYALPLPDPSNPPTLSHSNPHHPVLHQPTHPQYTYSYSPVPPPPPQCPATNPTSQNLPVQYALSPSHVPTPVNPSVPVNSFDQTNHTHQPQNPVINTSSDPTKSNSSSIPPHLSSVPTSAHPTLLKPPHQSQPSQIPLEKKDSHPLNSSSTPSSKTAQATEKHEPENISSPRKRKTHLISQDQDCATNGTSSSNQETQEKSSPLQKSKQGSAVKGQQLLRKPRKPYTITKSREVWTKDEHSRFLTALQMFDRDWKKIEAYIGTKTVLQIRSHAQKHFGKVAKYNTGEYIPPPRPKKRAVLPYPRSRSTTPSKAAVISTANGICASASGNGTASDSGTGSNDSTPDNRSLQVPFTPNTQENDNSLQRDPERSEAKNQPLEAPHKPTKCSKNGPFLNEFKESDAEENPSVCGTLLYHREGQTSEKLLAQSEKISVSMTVERSNDRRKSFIDTPNSEYDCENNNDGSRKDTISEKIRKKQHEHSRLGRSPCREEHNEESDRKTLETPDVNVGVCRKREVVAVAVGPAINVYSHAQAEGKYSREKNIMDESLLEANYPLLVLSNCVDMMSREKEDDPVGKQYRNILSQQPRLKKPRLQKGSVGSNNGMTMLATHKDNNKLRRIMLSTSPNQSNESSEESTEEREARGFQCRPSTAVDEGSPRVRNPRIAADEDGENADVHSHAQRSNTRSGSFSDDAIAGFSNSEIDMGSSCERSGRGSTDNSDLGDGDEEPKSSNEGSRIGAVLNTPSRDSSPLEPNSSLSRENSPNSNELMDGVNGVSDIEQRDRLIPPIRGQNTSFRAEQRNRGRLDSDMKNSRQACEDRIGSRFTTALGRNGDKNDDPRTFFHMGNNTKGSGHQFSNKMVMPSVPLTKGIANLINVPETPQINGDYVLHQEKDKMRMDIDSSAFANKNRQVTTETRSECDGNIQGSLRNVDRRSPSR